MTKYLKHFTATELIEEAFSRKDPEAAEALYMATSYHQPLFVKAWQNEQQVVGDAVDDLHNVMEWLRSEGKFPQADRVRTIAGRLARAINARGREDWIREVAKDWPEQLSPKESKKLLQEIAALREMVKQDD